MHDDPTPKSDDLDLLLDSALATYTDPGPSLSLTARILAAARMTAPQRQFRWMLWAIPATAALLLAILFVHRTQAPTTTSPVVAHLHPSGSAPSSAVASVEAVTPHPQRLLRHTELRAKASPLPRLDVFPAPTPLSPQEQAVVSLVNRDSPDSNHLAQQLTQPAPQAHPSELLRIAAIHIPPLNPPDNGNN